MPHGVFDSESTYLSHLESNFESRWPTIVAAKNDADQVKQLLFTELRRFTNDDVDVVVFGSLARQEWTCGSDVDWTLLVDGQANSEHRTAAKD